MSMLGQVFPAWQAAWQGLTHVEKEGNVEKGGGIVVDVVDIVNSIEPTSLPHFTHTPTNNTNLGHCLWP